MNSFTPTPEQERAILHPLGDLCVVAGAGSGKTAVLTQRYLRLVLHHGLPLRRVAALTFTDKAASQMRDRIARALEEVGRGELAEEVEFAPISTIHGYCARLLRLHAVDAGLDPAFRVLDEVESELMVQDATEEALTALDAGEPEALLPLLETPLDEGALRRLLDALRGAGRQPDDLLWHRASAEDPPDDAAFHAAAAAFAAAVEEEGPPVSDRGRAALAEVEAALEEDAWALLTAARAVRKVAPDGTKRGSRAFQTSRKALALVLESRAEHALDDLGASRVLPHLRRLLSAIDGAYAARRREEGALDFTDLEREAIRLLEDLHARERTPRLAPRALLVDEMQDTNPLQARLIEGLRRGGVPVFSVGDPKQSIYRFRRADVRVFEAERRRVGAEGEVGLTATFRTRPSLVGVLNELAARAFADGEAGVEAGALEAAGTFRDVPGPDVEMVVVDAGAGADGRGRRDAEARWIARRVRELVADRTPRARIERDGEGREVPARDLRYGDVAILLRARSHLSLYEEALGRERVPFVTHRGRGFFQADEVVDLLHVLRIVHDPADDHAFACFLTGPACAGSDEDLLRFFPPRDAGGDRTGRAWQAFAREAREGGPYAEAWRCVEALRLEAAAGRLGRVVEGALDDLGLIPTLLLRPDGARRAMNLRKVIALARRLERGGRHDLGDLLRHLTTLRDLEMPEAEATTAGGDDDVVRILTVHAAKGLEFPVVFLADVGRRAPNPEHAVAFDGEGAVATKLVHPLDGSAATPAGLRELRETEKSRQSQEDRRLLYVAMTRTEERLVVSASCAGLTRDGRPKGVSGWGSVLLDAIGRQPDLAPETIDVGAGTLSLARVEAPPERPEAPSPAPPGRPAAEAATEAARVLENARAPVAPLGDTPFVVSVSELMAFARSPAEAWRARHASESRAGSAVREPGDPADEGAGVRDVEVRRAERALLFDEEHPPSTGLDRAALGRAVHALLERHPSHQGAPSPELLDRVLEDELGGGDEKARRLLAGMGERFARSESGRLLAALHASGADVRREIAFHARIRFPRGARVADFDALLVRGAIDLWLPTEAGVILVDYKTNARGPAWPTPGALAEHYAVQLRLYALAAERLLGRDVAGARLVLLDPSWGEDVPEVEVDVAGEVLEDARRLCQAYALACLEDRWPEDWRALLGE